MRSNSLISAALVVAFALGASSAAIAGLAGPRPAPWITGNDTGGIIPYSPDIEGFYRQLAADHCARWDRLSRVTSVSRRYGGYVSFVCMDKPWIIH